MKLFILIIFFIVCFFPANSYAEAGSCTDTATVDFSDLVSLFQDRFPMNLMYFVVDLYSDIENVSPESPASFSIDFFGMTMQPLAFLDSSVLDVFMAAIRTLFLLLILFKMISHVLAYIL